MARPFAILFLSYVCDFPLSESDVNCELVNEFLKSPYRRSDGWHTKIGIFLPENIWIHNVKLLDKKLKKLNFNLDYFIT